MERYYGFRVTRICNARQASRVKGIRKPELLAELASGAIKCPVEGESVLVKHHRAGENLVGDEILKNPSELCEDPCPLCKASIEPSSGFDVEILFNNMEIRRAEVVGDEKILDFTGEA